MTSLTGTWPLGASLVTLAVAAALVAVFGFLLTRTVDELADRTGVGEALAGAVLLGATTSLPGLATVITGASSGDAAFTVANPLGGIVLQTVWLAVADLLYRRANLEHAAASLENILQAMVLVGLLAVVLVGYLTPGLAVLSVHPVTVAIPVLYGLGLVLMRRARRHPMWHAEQTAETREDEPQPGRDVTTSRLWRDFALFAVMLTATGYAVGKAGLGVVASTGLSSSLVGSTVTTAVSSLPELVTLLAAVRLGALTLGVADVIGGNVFDVLQLALADIFYRQGSLYADAGPAGVLLLAGGIFMTAVLTLGLLSRDEEGIGYETVSVLAIWAGLIAGVAYLG